MDWIYRIIVGIILIVAGLGYTGIRVLADMFGDPDEGPIYGWGPLLAGLGIAVIGVLVIL